MSSIVEQVKARLSIVDVVGSYLKLEPAGTNFKARCPFHEEKTPSFFVSPARGSYHCFGCNEGGDIISFVEEIENLDFVGALKLLAERAGVEFQPLNPRVANAKERLYLLMEAATRYYTAELEKNKEAIQYLSSRGLKVETIKVNQLGWAPDAWRSVSDELIKKGFSLAELIQGGLLVSNEKKYDRFRGRLMFPLSDNAGRIVAFSGRIFPPEKDTGAVGKYINSPETLLYNKSHLLYLYNRARMPIRSRDRCILVEGQFDALMAHQAGFLETVAISGTALTTYHIEAIKRLTRNLIMALDSDLAGINASRRTISLGLSADLEVKMTLLPNGSDPADLILKNPGAWQKAVDESVHVIDFLLLALQRQYTERRDLARAIEREVYPFVKSLANPIDEAHFVNKISSVVNLPEETIRAGLAKAARAISRGDDTKIDDLIEPKARLGRQERLESEIFGIIFSGRLTKEGMETARKRLGDARFDSLGEKLENRKDELLLATELNYESTKELEPILKELLDYWQAEVWRAELNELLIKIKGGDGQSGPDPTAEKDLGRCQELLDKINNLK